jgi:hypothetical protein
MLICYNNHNRFAARISLNRRMPTCYLLSNKLLLLAAILIAVYFIIMDAILLVKAKNRGPFAPILTLIERNQVRLNKNNKTSIANLALLNSDEYFINPKAGKQLVKWQHSLGNHPAGGIFWPLPIKKIMMAQTTHYIRSPLAEFVEYGFSFSRLFPFVSANSVSLFHCILSIVSVRFLIESSLFMRQIGVVIFQFRNFLDSFDGVVYRAQAKNSAYKSHYGSMGYFVDAFSDVFGGACLIFAISIYFIKHPPLKKCLTQCFRLSNDNIENLTPAATTTLLTNSNNEKQSNVNQIKSSSALWFSSSSNLSSSCCNANSKNLLAPFLHSTSSSFDLNESQHEQKNNSPYASLLVVSTSVGLLAIRLAVSGLFWDRSVHNYERLLDSQANSELHQVSLNMIQNPL